LDSISKKNYICFHSSIREQKPNIYTKIDIIMKKTTLFVLFLLQMQNTFAQNVSGFREVVFRVNDLDKHIKFYEDVAGYSLKFRGKVDKSLNRFWQLSEDLDVEEAFLFNRGDSTGFLRLVSINNLPNQELMRPSVQCWDTGGIFDLDVRVKNIEITYKKMIDYGWISSSLPHRYQFGKFDVSEILMRGFGGTTLALIQRHNPPLEGWGNIRNFSYLFNSTQVVRDFDKALDFYQNKLGFKIYMKTEALSTEPEINILGIPRNFVQKIKRKVAILQPQGLNVGSVEILHFEGFEGEDFSERTKPQNLGIFALRFPVKNIELYKKTLESNGVKIETPLTQITLMPYKQIKTFVVRSPEGAWLEFFEEDKF
jgi:catechol 2,3-dioxygenase-like lactoylglutathione lyase family enzyme